MVQTYKQLSTPPIDPLRRPIICFDGGNRTIQWLNPQGLVCQIPSFIKAINRTWEDVPNSSPSSVVIDFDGETFVLGQLAKDLGGTPVFEQNKTELAKKLVFAAIEPNPGQTAVRIDTLIAALPSSRNADTAYLKAIEGTWEYTRNGQAHIATIRTVKPIDETIAAYNLAVKHGYFKSKQNLNGVLDLGGGTSILRLYSTAGSLMREADQILPGTSDLARMIASRITRDLSGSPDLSLIMDGIESGSYEIGTTGYSFKPVFQGAVAEWLDSIKGQVKPRWAKWMPSLGEVLIIGGSAPLARPLEEATAGRFKLAPDSQTISIRGMAL